MASYNVLLSLILAHSRKDTQRFRSIIRAQAADLRKAGKVKAAESLEQSVGHHLQEAQIQKKLSPQMEKLVGDTLHMVDPKGGISSMVLAPSVAQSLSRIVQENTNHERLAEHGLFPCQRILVNGRPGTGKTRAASALAFDLKLPFFTLAFERITTKYMGETSARLGLLFEAIAAHEGVYLIDEVDALASRRGNDNDVGEASRIVNTLLMALDRPLGRSIVVAATNFPQSLDPAFTRRFDTRIDFPMPSGDAIEHMVKVSLPAFRTESLDWSAVAAALQGRSHAEIEAVAVNAAKNAVLDGDGILTTEGLVTAAYAMSPSGAYAAPLVA